MNRKRLAVLTIDLDKVCQHLERIGISLLNAHNTINELDRKADICEALNIPEAPGRRSIFDMIESVREINDEFKQYTTTQPGKEQGVRVVRFRGDNLQATARAETTKIILEVPTKALGEFVSKFGFEMFTDDLFDFCEREGW